MLPLPLLPVHCSLAALFFALCIQSHFPLLVELKTKGKNCMNVKKLCLICCASLFCNCTWRTIRWKQILYVFTKFSEYSALMNAINEIFLSKKKFYLWGKNRQFILSGSFRWEFTAHCVKFLIIKILEIKIQKFHECLRIKSFLTCTPPYMQK